MNDNLSFDGNGTNLSYLFFTSLVEYLFSILSSFLNREMGWAWVRTGSRESDAGIGFGGVELTETTASLQL